MGRIAIALLAGLLCSHRPATAQAQWRKAECTPSITNVEHLEVLHGTVWAATRNGVYELRQEACEFHGGPVGIADFAITSDGTVWGVSGVYGELFRFQGRSWDQYSGSVITTSGKPAAGDPISGEECLQTPWRVRVRAIPEVDDGIPYVPDIGKMIAFDPSDHLWMLNFCPCMPIYPYSVLRFRGTALECWSDEQVQFSMQMHLLARRNGEIWVLGDDVEGTRRLAIYSDGTWRVRPGPPEGSRLGETADGVVWAWGPNAQVLENGEWSTPILPEGVRCQSGALAADGTFWALTWHDGVLRLRGSTTTVFPYPPHITEAPQQATLAVDAHGTLWQADKSGAYALGDVPSAVTQANWGAVKGSQAQPSSPRLR